MCRTATILWVTAYIASTHAGKLMVKDNANTTIMLHPPGDVAVNSPRELATALTRYDAWKCEGDPPRCEKKIRPKDGVVYFQQDLFSNHRGMGTRVLGGPALTIENTRKPASIHETEPTRPPTFNLTVDAGDSPILKSGVEIGERPWRMQWSLDKDVLYDHTNGLPDDNNFDHPTEFRVGENFDLKLKEVTPRDAGRYTAIYRVHRDGAILETDIKLTILYLPEPHFFTRGKKVGKVEIKNEDERLPLTCVSQPGVPRARMRLYHNDSQIPETKVLKSTDERGTTQTVILTMDDIGSTIGCKMSVDKTKKTNSITITVHSLPKSSVEESRSKDVDKILEPMIKAMTTTVGIMIAATTIAVGIMIWRRRRGPQGTAPEEPDTKVTDEDTTTPV